MALHPFRIAGIVLGAFAAVCAAFLLVGLTLPATWEAERTTRIQASPDEIFPLLSSASRWEEWTPTPASGVELFGPRAGPGSGRRWDDATYGEGEFVITSAVPVREVVYEVAVEEGAIRVRGEIELTAVGGDTRIRWRETGDFGWNPLLGYLAGRMGEMQGEQLGLSLEALRRLVERGVREPRG